MEEENQRLTNAIATLKQQVDLLRDDKIRSAAAAFQSQHHDPTYPPTLRTDATVDYGPVCSHMDSHGIRNTEPTATFDTAERSHGPTSAVADEITSNRNMRKRGRSQQQEEPDTTRNQLVASAARLRT